MKDLLETVIKAALIEAPVTRAKLRSMDAADLATARREANAVFGYYAIVKGVSNEKTLLNAVAGATMGSQDSETRVGVGATGPYANGNFIYVVNTDDVNRKNVVAVYIIPNILKNNTKPVKLDKDDPNDKTQTEPNITVTRFGLMIGQSPMMSKTQYVARVSRDPVLAATAPKLDSMPTNTTGMQKAVQSVQAVVNKDKQPDVDILATSKPGDNVNQTPTNAQIQSTITNQKPSDIRAFQNWVINTKKDSAALGKFGADNKWGKLTKAAWIKYGAEYVKQFPNSAVDANQSQGNQSGDSNQGGGSGTGGGSGLKKGFSLNWSASATTAKQIPYFFYDNATKKFNQQTGSITVAKAKPKYQVTSTNKGYYLVEIDGKKVWIEKKYFK